MISVLCVLRPVPEAVSSIPSCPSELERKKRNLTCPLIHELPTEQSLPAFCCEGPVTELFFLCHFINLVRITSHGCRGGLPGR